MGVGSSSRKQNVVEENDEDLEFGDIELESEEEEIMDCQLLLCLWLLTEWLCFKIDYVIEMKFRLNSMHISIYNLFILLLAMGLVYWSTSCS